MLNRIKWYNKVKSCRKPIPVDRKLEHAKNAELRVLKKIAKNKQTIATFYQKRVPNVNKIRGFGEVDVIAITQKAVFAIEVKNWTGEIEIVDGNLVQKNRKPSKNNIFDHISTKADNIKFVYLSEFGKELFEVKPLIVMTNKNCKFSEAVEKHPMVIKTLDIKGTISKTTDKLEDYDSITIDELKMMLDKFPTWDTISLANTKEEIGDIPEESIPLKWSRTKYSSIDVNLTRGLFSTILLGPQLKISMRHHDGSLVEELIKPENETITLFRPTINSELCEFPITEIQSISFGCREKFDWESFSVKPISISNSKQNNGFTVGGIYKGRIVRDIGHAFLIVIKEKQLKGLLYKDKLNVHVDLINQFYSIGKTVKVKIKKFTDKGKTKCNLIEVYDED